MDGFTGFKTAAAEEIPTAVAVNPFHVVRLAGDALDECRRQYSWRSTATVATRATRSTPRAAPCTPEGAKTTTPILLMNIRWDPSSTAYATPWLPSSGWATPCF